MSFRDWIDLAFVIVAFANILMNAIDLIRTGKRKYLNTALLWLIAMQLFTILDKL